MDHTKHIKQLCGEIDWPLWKRKIRDFLDYHEGALDLIDGKLTKPEPLESNATGEQIKEHKKCSELYRKANSYAKSVLASSISDDVYQKVMDSKTAKDLWEALKQQFEASAKDQLFRICTDFFSFSWTAGEDVSTHIAKLKSLWSELNNGLVVKNENRLPELLLVSKTLQILPEEFNNFKSSWLLLSNDDKKTFDELLTQLCMHERNFVKLSNDKTMSEALLVKAGKYKKTKYQKRSVENDICNYCKQKGHWVKFCKRWIADGKPTKSKVAVNNIPDSNTNANLVTLMSVFEESCIVDTNFADWYVDNGATRHITNCKNLFERFEEFNHPCCIKAAGQERLNAIGKGSIQVISVINNKSQKMTLTDVWYVPKINRNLFSVLAAQDRNPNSTFISTATECWLNIGSETKLYGKRNLGGTLFKLDIQPILPEYKAEINVASADSSLLQLYHERWGHQDKRYVKTLLFNEFGINVKVDKELCEPCICGKSHRLPFGTREKVIKAGELISADVCGPFPESFTKLRYLVVFKDSYTKFRYGYVIKCKSEVKNCLRAMLVHAKTSGHTIKNLLSDNGGEFDNEEIKSILCEEGITQKLTAPYTPEQNGGSEREMRTIVEMARTFKYSNPEVIFPDGIWAEFVATSIYILNRTGKSSIEGISPYELWLNKKPRIKHLRIIGSTCYAHIPIQRRRKMDKKAVKGYLIGYDGEERYRIWLKEMNKVFLSKDITFNEKLVDCKEYVELSSKDFEIMKLNDQLNQGKCPEKSDKIVVEDETESSSRNRLDEVAVEDKSESFNRQLRNRLTLQKPNRLEYDVMEAEMFTSQVENSESFEDAINSKQCESWRKIMEGKLGIEQIPTEHQVADMMTKALPKPRLITLREKMGML